MERVQPSPYLFREFSNRMAVPERTAFFCIAAMAVIVTAAMGWHWTAIPLLVFSAYILENLIFALFRV